MLSFNLKPLKFHKKLFLVSRLLCLGIILELTKLNSFVQQINPDDYARRKREIQTSSPSAEEINRITDFAIKSFERFKNKNI